MVNQPENFITDFVQAGADIITVHAEATVHLHRTLQEIRKAGVKAGVSLNPATPLNILEYILDDLDLILIMSVNPGFGGQNYIPAMTTKIRNLRGILDRNKNKIILEVDGGVKFDNAAEILHAGADILVVGSDIFSSGDSESRTRLFKSIEVTE
jgi:ribulose-phosphate 3-epimerase